MRFGLAGAWTGLAALAQAGEGYLGTKADPVTMGRSGGPGMGVLPLLQMAVAVSVVFLLLKFVVPKAVTRFGKGLKTPVSGGIRIDEAAQFAGGTLNVVSVRGRTLLLSVGTQGVSCLADLSEPNRATEPPTFQEMVELASTHKSASRAPQAVIETSGAESELDPDEIQAALNRARLLAM